MEKKAALSYITSLSTILVATLFLLFPVFFLTITTDFFSFPKQVLVVFASLLLLVLWAIRSLNEGKTSIVSNPLNLPVFLFAVVVMLSAIFSNSRFDSIVQAVPVVLAALSFYGIVNFIQDRASFTVALTSLILGSAISAILTILATFNIYLLPFQEIQNQLFNTHGAPIQFLAFSTPLLILCVASISNLVKEGKFGSFAKKQGELFQLVCSLIFAGGIGAVFYQIIISPQKPILLPFNHGFQIGLASISQDSARAIQAFLLGSGYGTFANDFTRFVLPSFNSLSFWNLTFSFSSSFVLEILATTGILGIASFAFIAIKFFQTRTTFVNPLFLATLSTLVLALILPFSFSMVFLFFALLGLYIAHLNIKGSKYVSEVSLNFVALQKGFLSVTEEGERKRNNMAFPILMLVGVVVFASYILFFLVGDGQNPRKGYVQLLTSDIKFAKSFTPAALQNGTETYNLQTQAITEYPYRSDYYRLFSQVNLALAASLVNAQEGNSSPSADVQNNILGLLQQSINSARQAVTLSPFSSANWQNLAQIYRNLIGVGENAEQFAVASINQAITLNPSNPGLRIELGGIFFQLGEYEQAQNQFIAATQLKPDFANAYYNLGKSLEQKEDLQGALSQYQIVRQLVANDPTNLEVINSEIAALEERIGQQAGQPDGQVDPSEDTTPLGVDQPEAEFPEQDPRVEIPEPPLSTSSAQEEDE